ncbi:MAG: helix-turn-helix transcriptional regulator [Lachnospiraceae bacterium]|nr:helix-turn-helix transcriptional regulator [Lachnospiraceae bacterium]
MNERIKELRTILGLSAEKFGSRVGVTRSAISRIENGKKLFRDFIHKLSDGMRGQE